MYINNSVETRPSIRCFLCFVSEGRRMTLPCCATSDVSCINMWILTCAGLRLLIVDLQEDECREEQQPAAGLVRGLLQRGSSSLSGWVQDPTGATEPERRGMQGRGRGAGGEGAGCLQRPQSHRNWSAGRGWIHGQSLRIFLYSMCFPTILLLQLFRFLFFLSLSVLRRFRYFFRSLSLISPK